MARPSKEKLLVRKMERLAQAALNRVEESIGEARAFDAARSAGLLLEKIQLLKGKPTGIIGVETPKDELLARLKAVAKTARRERSGGDGRRGDGSRSDGQRGGEPRSGQGVCEVTDS